MADYKLAENGVVRTSDGACIPDAPGNRDWQEYQEWLAIPNDPDPQFTLAEVKASRKLEFQGISNSEILAEYPIYKQININELQDFIQDDKDTMWTFINARRTKCNGLEDDIDAASTIAEVDALTW